jgi:hypothetical protein
MGACQDKEHHHASYVRRSRSDPIGIDMGKNTLHMIGLDTRGGIVLQEKVPCGRITSRLKQVPPTYAKPFR